MEQFQKVRLYFHSIAEQPILSLNKHIGNQEGPCGPETPSKPRVRLFANGRRTNGPHPGVRHYNPKSQRLKKEKRKTWWRKPCLFPKGRLALLSLVVVILYRFCFCFYSGTRGFFPLLLVLNSLSLYPPLDLRYIPFRFSPFRLLSASLSILSLSLSLSPTLFTSRYLLSVSLTLYRLACVYTAPWKIIGYVVDNFSPPFFGERSFHVYPAFFPPLSHEIEYHTEEYYISISASVRTKRRKQMLSCTSYSTKQRYQYKRKILKVCCRKEGGCCRRRRSRWIY
jgi:hypothetical protein